jgi:hypothetical protein
MSKKTINFKIDTVANSYKDFLQELQRFFPNATLGGSVETSEATYITTITNNGPLPKYIIKLADECGLKVVNDNEIQILTSGKDPKVIQDKQKALIIRWGKEIKKYEKEQQEKEIKKASKISKATQ